VKRKLPCSIVLLLVFLLGTPWAFAEGVPTIEAQMVKAIREVCYEGDDIYVKFVNLPVQLRERLKVKNINFLKIPDATGDGLCSVEIEEKNGRDKAVQVAFRVSAKRKLFILKEDMKKGDSVRSSDIVERETYFNNGGGGYPKSLEDVLDKRIKKDLKAGTTLTASVLEEPMLVQRGDVVNIVVQSRRLTVQTQGRALDRGKIGDTVRAKNISSGKEVVGKLTAGNTITVSFASGI
jgi:flagellar basal body P-ring formation protein FlgA